MHRPNRRRAPLIALAVIMTFGLGACGDDDEETTQPTETTAVQPRGSDTVTIEMRDHSYTVSGPLNAGGTLRISNVGREVHMMGLGRLRPGKTLQDLQAILAEFGPGGPGEEPGEGGTTTTARGGTTTTGRGGTTTTGRGGTTTTAAGGAAGGEEEDPTAEVLEEVGYPGNVMSPGESVEITVPTLSPGRYALVCFVPTEGEGVPHVAKGMLGELEVVAGPTPPQPTPDATYRLAPGQAVQGPAELAPGRRTLKFEAAAGSQQLEPTIIRLNQGATYVQVENYFDRFLDSEEPPPSGVASRAPGQILFAGFDLEDVTTFYLTTELRAGSYVIAGTDRDPDPTPPALEVINVRVG